MSAPVPPAESAQRNLSLFMTVTVSLALMLAGAVYGLQRWSELRRETWSRLTSLAEHDARQLTEWRNERLAIGRNLQRDEDLVRLAVQWRDNAGATPALQALSRHLAAQTEDLLALEEIQIACGDKRLRVWPESASPEVKGGPRGATQEVTLEAFPGDAGEEDRVALRIPLTERDNRLVLLDLIEDLATSVMSQLDGARRLFRTGSVMVFARSGGGFHLIAANDAFSGHQQARLLASSLGEALRTGQRGTMQGEDLQNRATFGHIIDVPGTPWLLVHQVERSEVEGPFIRQSFSLVGIFLLLLWAGGGTLYGLWRSMRQRQADAEAAISKQRDALARQVDYLQSNDRHAVISVAPDGRILEFNARAVEMYGYTDRDWHRLLLGDLHADGVGGAAAELKQLADPSGITCSSRHRTRTGTVMDIEINAQPGVWRDQTCILCVVRDVTERADADRRLKASEELYRSLFHGANYALLLLENERVIDCNPRAEAMYGWPREQLVGLSVLQLLPEDSKASAYGREMFLGYLENARADRLHRMECEQQRQNGTRLLAEVTLSIARSGDRPILLAIVRDITEQRRIETELKRSQADLEAAESLARLGHWSVELETRRLRWSPHLSDVLALSVGADEPRLDDLLGRIAETDRDALMQRIDRTIRHGEQTEITVRYVGPDGGARWVYVRIGPRRNDAGIVTELFGTIMDVTPQKTAEIAVHDSAVRYRTLVEQLPAVVYAQPIREDGPAAFVSPSIETLTGYTAAEWVATMDMQLGRILAEDRERLGSAFERCRAGITPLVADYRMRDRDGRIIWVHDQAALVRDHSGQPICVQGVLMDITARKRDEESLELLETALAAASSGVLVTDAEGRVEWVNEAATRMYGCKAADLLGRRPATLEEDSPLMSEAENPWTALRAGRVWHGDVSGYRKDGTPMEEEMSVTPVCNAEGRITHLVVIAQDVTERRKLQLQLLRGQRLECLGRLASGVAHDFNNLLQTITGCGELLGESLKAAGANTEDLHEIQQAAERAAALTRQLLAFSRQQPIKARRTELPGLLDGMLKLLRRLLGEDIALEMCVASRLPAVMADHGQLEQVVMNLAVNARDAMPSGGKLSISADAVELDAVDVVGIPGSRAGSFVRLRLEDTGTGMDPEVLEHIFEPFFSTKPPEKGTGLGLAVVYGIVEQHNGFMQVTSQLERGTRFDIWIPAEPALAASSVETQQPAPRQPQGRGEHILLVEDEDRVRRTVVQMLRSAHFQVEAASTIAEARTLIEGRSTDFDLILLDVVLPDGNGLAFAEELLQKNITSRIVFQTGYSDDKSRWAAIQERGFRLLQKPYRREELLQTFAIVLHGSIETTRVMETTRTS